MRKWTIGLNFGGHVIHPYENEMERERAVLELAQWAPKGSKFLYLADRRCKERRLQKEERELEAAFGSRKDDGLEILSAPDVYCRGGKFIGKEMIGVLKDLADEAADTGYRSMVAVGDLSWLARRPEDFRTFIGYEISVNFTRFNIKSIFLCQYDQRIFSSDELHKATLVHEQVLLDRTLRRNHWFIPRHGSGERMLA